MTSQATELTLIAESTPAFEIAHDRKYHVNDDTGVDDAGMDDEAAETEEPRDATSDLAEPLNTTPQAEIAEPSSGLTTGPGLDLLSSVGLIAIAAIVLVPITLWTLKR